LIPTPAPELLVARPGTKWNFELVGHHAIGSVGWHSGLALKDRCAYVGNGGRPEINILDVSDPTEPAHLGALDLPSGSRPVEVRTLPDLDLLVVADLSSRGLLLTYDVSNCAEPTPLGSLTLPHAAHEFYLWRDRSRVLAYGATFTRLSPTLVVIDLTDPAEPVEVARWTAADDGVPGILHSLSVSLDGTRAYLAMWDGGFVVAEVDLPRIEVVRGLDGGFSPADYANTHSAVAMQDPNFVLLASEVFSCPFNGLAIAHISDPAYPEIVSRFTLPENRCENLPGPGAAFTPHNPLVVGELAFVSWYAAGVQAVDLSEPYAPRRAGQFVPTGEEAAPRSLLGSYPVQMFSYPILRDGLLYVADSQSGLYVLRYTGPRAEQLEDVTQAEGNVTILLP